VFFSTQILLPVVLKIAAHEWNMTLPVKGKLRFF